MPNTTLNRKRNAFVLLFIVVTVHQVAAQKLYWDFANGQAIQWNVSRKDRTDHIEMSGARVSAILRYGNDNQGQLVLRKKLIFPMLRTIPNNTHGSLTIEFNDPQMAITVNGELLTEIPETFRLDGKLTITSHSQTNVETIRTLFPSVDKAAFIERVLLKNMGNVVRTVKIQNYAESIKTDPSKGVYGQYVISSDVYVNANRIQEFEKELHPNEELSFSIIYSGSKVCEELYTYAASYEQNKRDRFLQEVQQNLVLETPNDTIDRTFAFAKIRATESIYDTKGGLMHSPGGGPYYAAIWANDQAEYANPFFPYLGNINGNESALNSFRHFARFMNAEYNPIPSSIVAEGVDVWNGAGDRGDMAMIAYGASLYALASGKEEVAQELWPLITWCFEFLERKITTEGVIASDTDELENRFPAGKVNLSTNSLAYGAYIAASNLAIDLKRTSTANSYREKAKNLRIAIEKYFGANVEGFNTYKYHAENTRLRSWICLPLVMGIDDRKEETIKALFSKYLWTNNGILTESGSATFWDRATLYAFRGLLVSGATDECLKYLNYYSATRLLGEHVPYPVEAWPEGDQRHLAAESALYCRVITEGLFGFAPVGLKKFTVAPLLPRGWNRMNLRNIKAFDKTFDLEVKRQGNEEIITLRLADGTSVVKKWNRKAPLLFELQ